MVEVRQPDVNEETAVSVKFSFRLGPAAGNAVAHTVRHRSHENHEEAAMHQDSNTGENVVLLRGAALWLLAALVLAWCMVGLDFGLPMLHVFFTGKFTRLLQAHLDFLLMSALIFGFYAARITLPWHVRWAMVVGAFTNSSLFLMQAIFPALDTSASPEGAFPAAFRLFTLASVTLTSYGFGKGAVIVLLSTFKKG